MRYLLERLIAALLTNVVFSLLTTLLINYGQLGIESYFTVFKYGLIPIFVLGMPISMFIDFIMSRIKTDKKLLLSVTGIVVYALAGMLAVTLIFYPLLMNKEAGVGLKEWFPFAMLGAFTALLLLFFNRLVNDLSPKRSKK